MRDGSSNQLIGLLFVTSSIIAWELVSRYGDWPAYLLPSPLQVAQTLWHGIVSGTIPEAALLSLRRAGLAFLAALTTGAVLGAFLVESRNLGELLRSVISGLQSIPGICWFPLALVWVGLNEGSVYLVTFLGALFSITTTVAAGLRQIPGIYAQAARTMGVQGFRLYRFVFLPALMPALVAGARQGWAFAWRSLMAAELLFHNGGVGYLLMRARELNDVAGVIGMLLVILVIGALVERLLFERVDGCLRTMWGVERSP